MHHWRRLTIPLVVATVTFAGCASPGDRGAADAPATTAIGADDTAASATTPVTSRPVPAPTEPAPTEPAGTDPAPTASAPVPTEPVATEPPPTEPAAAEPAARSYDFSAVGPIVEAFVDERDLNGAGLVIVHRDDGVVHEQYWGEFDAERISLIASASKMLTAGVLLHLDDQGLLDVDAPVADVVGWGEANAGITPAQLLSNSSGLVGLGPDPGYAPYVCQFLATGTLQECAATVFTTPDDDADIVAPDTEFRYGGAQWQVAGAVAEVASGTTWDELIEEIYVEPCGVDSLGYNNHWVQIPGGFEYPDAFGGDPSTLVDNENPNMEGGAYVTPPDYAELLLMHLRGGRCGDVQVLSQDAVDRMHADRVGAVYGAEASPGNGYGMGWWIDRETGRLTDPGAYGAVPWLDLADGYGAYLVVEENTVTGLALAEQLYDVVDDAVAAAT